MEDILKVIKVWWSNLKKDDRSFFRVVWTAAVVICAIAVIISAASTAAAAKKEEEAAKEAAAEAAAEAEASESDAEQEVITVATVSDAEKGLSIYSEEDQWMLTFVNNNHHLSYEYKVGELKELRNNQSVDARIYEDLQNMFDDMREEGLNPLITASYEEHEDGAAYDSEFQIGLAIRVGSDTGTEEDTNANREWINENGYKYGFIERYPADKADITGVTEDPGHYRYVGIKAATAMHDANLCLEEFLGIE